jgi:hypothetical protein
MLGTGIQASSIQAIEIQRGSVIKGKRQADPETASGIIGDAVDPVFPAPVLYGAGN